MGQSKPTTNIYEFMNTYAYLTGSDNIMNIFSN